ncbi:elongation factor EF-3 [Coccomyxa subellipsoidea C-169]|uniref:Elongation factor 3 n=1 Tax=Coccomyxa subellipsoidea (strain C-169) TaxID=574566 RepID=I0YWU5_COCSC|nr:elongation factor EF-3 [Coccomyxa subellipsoidea C-169]EIE22864.1 elongation factor EF-3 [Coccomyxa subellipsoidea C-169]|eukprot:XP_005647408.1 elongation factor EF-3 [Coccomyxa subellipsoidea C-169]
MVATTEVAVPASVVSTEETKTVLALMKRLSISAEDAERTAAISEVVALVKKGGVAGLKAGGLVDRLAEAANSTTDPLARQGAFETYTALIKEIGTPVEPFVALVLATILEKCSDKVTPVREAASATRKAFTSLLNEQAIKVVLPELLAALDTKKNWQTKNAALACLGELTKRCPSQVSKCLPDIIPAVSAVMGDAKPQVKTAATKAMKEVCAVVGNRDIEPFIPVMVSCIARPTEVPDCVHKLGATTFVQAVEAPALSIMTPLLIRGLKERATAVKRKAALIIDNMAKLVDNPNDAAVFLPRLLPGLEKVSQEVPDPECRTVASKARDTLLSLVQDPAATAPAEAHDFKVVLPVLKDLEAKHSNAAMAEVPSAIASTTLEYVAALCSTLIWVKNFEIEDWQKCVVPYLSEFMEAAAVEKVCAEFLDKSYMVTQDKAHDEVEEEEGVDLCDCEFSLAYGAKILLNNTRLRLKKGRRYGLCGPNGAGKSTLMRAIANGQVDGFPPKEELRTVYVEHDIDAELSDISVVDYVFADPVLKGEVTLPQVTETLGSVGFTENMQNSPVASLSGGWKMKLALARAMLQRAEIMLLDEPTNHLDVKNVAWLVNYLTTLTDVTSVIVSHDSGFLDNVCQSIIHYENRKLKIYKGNLSEFVKKKPEARSYYELASTQGLSFVLPEPGFLEGVKTKDRPILKMHNVAYKYPTAEKNTLEDISLFCTLNSRVAVLGPNGAGKSTMIKVLTGELEPTGGSVWKHPNMRIAYVAQHAFHHIEQHLEKTPNEYIRWRYAIGEDRENLTKVTRQISAEEAEKMAAQHKMEDGTKRVLDKLVSRRKMKKSYEYEVQWKNCTPDQNTYIVRDKLVDMGFEKLVNELDVKEAARLGMHTRPLTTAQVQQHLQDLGIDPEFGTHSHIRGLSGGQKVKVVLAAAMWNSPHMLVLDEPTNYLDRESLGALAAAIKTYGGGVVMISHHSEFTSALCPEKWTMEAGRLHVTGQNPAAANVKLEWKPEEETVDAFGNIVKIKQQKKTLNNKEKKKAKKLRDARRARGEEVSDSEDEE